MRHLILCVALVCFAHPASPVLAAEPAAEGITRVDVHQEGTAREVLGRIAAQGNVFLRGAIPDDGPRKRFDADKEPFWPAMLRACAAFDLHVVPAESSRRLTIGKGAVPTQIASPPESPVTIFTQSPAGFIHEYRYDGDDRPYRQLGIRTTAAFDPALIGDIAAYGEEIDVTEAMEDKVTSLKGLFRPAIGMHSHPPGRPLMLEMRTLLNRSDPDPDPRWVALLKGSAWFVALNRTETVSLDLANGVAGPKEFGGATVRIDSVANAPAGRRDVRVRIDRGMLSEGCWQLIRPQIAGSLEVSLVTASGRKLKRHWSTSIEDLKGWHDTDKSLDAIHRFEMQRAKGLPVDGEPVRVVLTFPTDARLVTIPVQLTDFALPPLPKP